MVRWLSWFASMKLIDSIRIEWPLRWLSKEGICRQLTIVDNVDLVFWLGSGLFSVFVLLIICSLVSSGYDTGRSEEVAFPAGRVDFSSFDWTLCSLERCDPHYQRIQDPRTPCVPVVYLLYCLNIIFGHRLVRVAYAHKVLVVIQSKIKKRLPSVTNPKTRPTSKSATLPSDRALHLRVTNASFIDVLSMTPCSLCWHRPCYMSAGSGSGRAHSTTSDEGARVPEQTETQHKDFMEDKDSRVYTSVIW